METVAAGKHEGKPIISTTKSPRWHLWWHRDYSLKMGQVLASKAMLRNVRDNKNTTSAASFAPVSALSQIRVEDTDLPTGISDGTSTIACPFL